LVLSQYTANTSAAPRSEGMSAGDTVAGSAGGLGSCVWKRRSARLKDAPWMLKTPSTPLQGFMFQTCTKEEALPQYGWFWHWKPSTMHVTCDNQHAAATRCGSRTWVVGAGEESR
jgi:hypothetical protein